MQEPEDI